MMDTLDIIFAVAKVLLAAMAIGLWQQQVALDEIARKEEMAFDDEGI